jgi:radical SAM protein with 4Fe4S-binding SPASM domain
MGKTFSEIKDATNFFGTLTIAKLFNYLLINISFYLSRLTRRSKHMGMPVSISVEPTTSCNLRCPECPSGLRQFSRPQGKIVHEDFRKVIDQLSGRLMYLILYFQGEPFLNPEIFEMIKYASHKKIYTATSTNGHFLDDENAKKVVESGLDRLIISVDGIDQETYENYRKGGDLDTVLKGIGNLTKWKKKLKSSRPFIILQFLVFKTNEHQIPEIKLLAKKLQVDRLELKTAQIYNYEDDTKLIPDNPEYSRYIKTKDNKWKLKKPIRNRCFRMWSGTVITWDGRLVPCCFDKDASHQLGTLDEHTFKEIWRSNAYNDFRQQILSDRSKIDICGNCTE